MLEELPTPDLPQWLEAASDPLGALPIRDMLDGSVFYPACDVDGDPIKYLNAHFHSFVYVDYGIGRPRLCEELETFRGYRVLASRPVVETELTPQGWSPRFPAGYMPQRAPPSNRIKLPFAEWIVYERLPEYPEAHGPKRFSLLYVGGDGPASYQAMYHGNHATPAVIAIIRPGTGFGGNWTDFRKRDDILAWSVLDAVKRRPRWLLEDGDHPCWQEFSKLVRELRPGLRLWEWGEDEDQEQLSTAVAHRHERLHEVVFKSFCDAMSRDLKHRFWTGFSTELARGSLDSSAHNNQPFFADVSFTIRLNRECSTPKTSDVLKSLVDQIVGHMADSLSAMLRPVMRVRIKDVRTIWHSRSADVTLTLECADE